MIRVALQFALVVTLACAVGALTLILWRLWDTPTAVASMSTGGSQQGRARQTGLGPATLTPAPLAQYQQTLARPLFVEGRRPPEAKPQLPAQPAVQAAVRQEVPLERFRLLGVHLDAGTQRALIETPTGARSWVAQGEAVGEWTLGLIDAERVELKAQGRHGELRLYPKATGLE